MGEPAESNLQVLELIDSGLYGRVFRARQLDLDRVVAVKIIKPEYSHRANAVGHAKALARVGVHPNVVTVYSVQDVTIESVSMPAMLMEWLEGETFGVRLGGPRFSEQELRRICVGVLDGMERMHRAGVHHGDLHFGNVILLTDCQPKIIDIDASQNRSLGRLSDLSRDGAIAADVDYCRQLIHRTFSHSVLSPSLVNQLDVEMSTVSSLLDIRTIVERALDGPRTPSYAAQNAPDGFAMSAEELSSKVEAYIEENRPASLHGLVMGQMRRIRDELIGDRFPVSAAGKLTPELVRERITQYGECCGAMIPALAVGCYWGNDGHWTLWKQCIETVANCYEDLGYGARSGTKVLLDFRQYPPLLLLYASGLGAFLHDRFDTIRFLMSSLEYVQLGRRQNLAEELQYWKAEQAPVWDAYVFADGKRHFTPVSDHLSGVLYHAVGGLTPLRSTFETQFDRFEYFLALMYCSERPDADPDSVYAPGGTYLWRRAQEEPDFGEQLLAQAKDRGEAWPPFRAGLFGRDLDVLERSVRLLQESIEHHRDEMHVRRPRRPQRH